MASPLQSEHTPPSLVGAEWLSRAETQSVLALLDEGGYSARAVGGCVRNALLGVPVKDIDIATTAHPQDVVALAGAAGFRVVPTGLAHGTVTVVVNHVPYEVTTLREDVETFGRHARVAFTQDWAADARRRDFTMNALYCAADGTVHDPLGGYGDLLARRVRFIGDAIGRIREDYLRIMRLYRLHAEYGEGGLDAASHEAAIRERDGLARLSGERIHAELSRLLGARGGIAAITDMAECGILQLVLGVVPRLRPLARLIALEEWLGLGADPALRLAVLAVATEEDARHLRERLKLSTNEAVKLARASIPRAGPEPEADRTLHKAHLYRQGTAAFREGVLLDWARSGAPIDDAARRELWELPAQWGVPTMPFSGRDVMALGVPAGPRIGHILRAFESWWIAEGFPGDEKINSRRLEMLAAEG